MTRKLVLLDILLLVVLGALAWQLRQEWLEARQRERKARLVRVKPVPAPPLPPLAAAEPVSAGKYVDVAQKLLFSKDRNPTVVVEVPPPPKIPPFPVFHGVLNLGDGPTAILSAKPGDAQRGYQPGETVGDFKLLAVNREDLVLEFDGKPITKKFEELVDRKAAKEPAPAAQAAAKPAQPVAPPAAPAKAGEAPYGAFMDAEYRFCRPGDNTPVGTVVDGFRKIMINHPMGKQCRWVAAK